MFESMDEPWMPNSVLSLLEVLLELSFDIPVRFVDALVTASIGALPALTRHCFDPGFLCKIPLAVIKFRASTEKS